MPKTPDRVPGPTAGPVCPECRFWWPVATAEATKLDLAEHDVAHLEWESERRYVPATAALAAYRRLLPLLRAAHGERSKRLSRQVVDYELEVADLTYDLTVARELADDLKAELAAVVEGRHA